MDEVFSLEGIVRFGEGDMTATVIGTLRPIPKPAKVLNLTAVINDTDVTLSWFDGGDATAWRVFRDDVFKIEVNSPSWVDATVVDDTDYVYHVISKNQAGESEFPSDDLLVHTAALDIPAQPTGVDYSNPDTGQTRSSIELSWDFAANVLNWTVKRDTVVVGTVTIPKFTDSGLSEGTEYDYQIIANNDSGSSTPADFTATTLSNSAPRWTNITTLPNGAVGQLYAFDFIVRSPPYVIDDEGDPIALSIAPGSNPLPTGVVLNGTSLTGFPSNSGSFSPTIRASDGFDTTDQQFFFDIAVAADTTAPTTPQLATPVVTGGTISIGLATPSTDASGIERYTISRKDNGAGGFAVVGTLPNEGSFPFVQTNVPAGTYEYRASSRDASPANNVSAFSDIVNATVAVANPNPDAPINFSASATDIDEITLTWQPGPSGAAVTDYDMDFSTTAGTGQGAAPWSALTVGNQTSFVHGNRLEGTRYYYRLKAKSLNGESAYVFANAQPGARVLFAEANFDSGAISNQPSSRSDVADRMGNGIFIKAVAKTQGAGAATKWANTNVEGVGAFGPGGIYDCHIQSTEVWHGETIRPRAGAYFLRSACYRGADPTTPEPNYTDVHKHYEGPNITGYSDNGAHVADKCKPRTEMGFHVPAYEIPYDTRFFVGWSLYLPTDTEAEQQRKGHGSGPQIIEQNLSNDADTTQFSFHLNVPENSYINATDPSKRTIGNSIGAQNDLWWCLSWERDPTTHIQGGNNTKVALSPILSAGNSGSDRGKWTDFVMEVCYNPFTSATIYDGWNFRANTGLFRIWKSSGVVDGSGNRTWTGTPLYEVTSGGFGLRPRPASDPKGRSMPDMNFKHYCYWIRSDVPGGTSLSKGVFMGFDEMRWGFAEDKVHAGIPASFDASNLVTKYQGGRPTTFADVQPRS